MRPINFDRVVPGLKSAARARAQHIPIPCVSLVSATADPHVTYGSSLNNRDRNSYDMINQTGGTRVVRVARCG